MILRRHGVLGGVRNEDRHQKIRQANRAGLALEHKAHQREDTQIDERSPQDELGQGDTREQ
jgi:hypothetical protein